MFIEKRDDSCIFLLENELKKNQRQQLVPKIMHLFLILSPKNHENISPYFQSNNIN